MKRRVFLAVPAVTTFVAAVLVAFHGWLLALRLSEGEFGDPGVALRWLGGLGLTAALIGLRRSGVPLLRGRKAFVFWLLVLLLHWNATVGREQGAPLDELILAVPASVVSVVFAAALLVAVADDAPRVPLWRASRIPLAVRGGALAAGSFSPLAARPPPL